MISVLTHEVRGNLTIIRAAFGGKIFSVNAIGIVIGICEHCEEIVVSYIHQRVPKHKHGCRFTHICSRHNNTARTSTCSNMLRTRYVKNNINNSMKVSIIKCKLKHLIINYGNKWKLHVCI
jgi:hypothetical protein